MLDFAFLITIAIALVAFLAIGFAISRLYRRCPKDVAFVRTGLGGKRVILDGGTIVLPVFHENNVVNMQTLKLEVERKTTDALITKDRMRVDIGAEFYVRVKPDTDSVSLAAQVLGDRTQNPENLKELIEAKLVDGLRSVAATMELDDLHESRTEFVKSVENSVSNDLEKNGLELESVSITSLDQTSTEHLNPNNAFDAVGLAKLTAITEERRKARNDAEQNAKIAIAEKNKETEERLLEVRKAEETARISNEQDIAERDAEARAAVAKKKAEARREQEEAEVAADLAVKQSRIAAERDTEIAQQDQKISVAQKSKAQSAAEAEANEARAEAVEAEERVKTVAMVASAERDRETAVIKAKELAEADSAAIVVRAEAEQQAAEASAIALIRAATAEADAIKVKASADEERFRVEAAGQEALNAAANALDEKVIDLQVKQATLAALPEVWSQAMKPVEMIDSIRIVDLGALSGASGSGGSGGEGAGHGGSVPAQLTDAMLNYQAKLPLVKQLLEEIGVNGSTNLHEVTEQLMAQPAAQLGDAKATVKAETRPDAAGASVIEEKPTVMTAKQPRRGLTPTA